MSWSQSYRVRFWNPDQKPGNGYIDGYHRARDAKMCVEKVNAQFDKDGHGIRAEYLGKPTQKKESAA